MNGSPRIPQRESPFPARDQALALLDEICEYALEVPLSHVDSMTSNDLAVNPDSSRFKWLRDLIVKEIKS